MLHWQLSHHQFSWPTHCDSRIHGLPPSVAAYTQHRLIWLSSTCSPKLCLNSRECGIFNSKALRQPLITCPSSPSHGIQVPYVHWNEKGLDIDYHVSSYCTCIHNSMVVCQPHSFLVAHWLWIRGVASDRPWLALPADNLHLLVASKYVPKSCHLPSHVDADRLYVASTSFRIVVTSVAPLPQEENCSSSNNIVSLELSVIPSFGRWLLETERHGRITAPPPSQSHFPSSFLHSTLISKIPSPSEPWNSVASLCRKP